MSKLFPTTLVGSYAQPDWLIDREKLAGRFPPRVRAKELWRVAPEWLEQAQDDATLLAIRDQERAGLDIITDGEMRRESYSNRFATALEGVDIDNPGTALDRSGHPNPVPRVVGQDPPEAPGRAARPRVPQGQYRPSGQDDRAGSVHDVAAGAERLLRDGRGELALDYAAAVNEEIRDLFAAGADVVQIDEPYMQARAGEGARATGAGASTARSTASTGTTALHICFGYAAIIHERPEGYSFLPELAEHRAGPDLDRDRAVEPRHLGAGVAAGEDDHPRRARSERRHGRDARRSSPSASAGPSPTCRPNGSSSAPDCGLKYLPRDVAFGKMTGDGRGRGDRP